LSRAALASIHPALLADPQDGNNILYAFGFPATSRPVTIPAKTVFSRLKFVVTDFSDDDLALCTFLSELRNHELRTGALAFNDLTTGRWIAGFYRVVQKIAKRLGFTLEDVLGREEGASASALISSAAQDVTKVVNERVGKLRGKVTILSSAELAERRKQHEPGYISTRYMSGGAAFARECPGPTDAAIIESSRA
jgi:hypothetical protein